MGMKASSGLFAGTNGSYASLFEDMFNHVSSDGKTYIDFTNLPGNKGIAVKKRLTQEQMEYLTQKHGVEFAQVYIHGKGKNGRGGKYYLYSGDDHSVLIPLGKDVMLISHTHPKGTPYASTEDMKLMSYLKQLGSPQNTSTIYPVGNQSVKFDRKRRKK